jgi:HAD superfamily hydrolase (TIGR01549 family)
LRSEIGLPPDTPVLEGALALEGNAAQRAWEIIERHERIGAESATLVAGVADLLEELQRRRIHAAIVTRNGRTFARQTLARLQLPFELVMTRDDAPPKPDPAALLHILEKWRIEPARAAMVGDFRFDLEAGRAAAMRTVLYAADVSEEELVAWRPLADLVLPSFVDCRPLLTWLDQPTSVFQT